MSKRITKNKLKRQDNNIATNDGEAPDVVPTGIKALEVAKHDCKVKTAFEMGMPCRLYKGRA